MRQQLHQALHHRDEGGGRHGPHVVVQVLEAHRDGREHPGQEDRDQKLQQDVDYHGNAGFVHVAESHAERLGARLPHRRHHLGREGGVGNRRRTSSDTKSPKRSRAKTQSSRMTTSSIHSWCCRDIYGGAQIEDFSKTRACTVTDLETTVQLVYIHRARVTCSQGSSTRGPMNRGHPRVDQ
ncbi:hypothetical protein EYF80_052238 [Liparis tanakae]|uniref:Uncharacterized protein n=1 Tax=Liparis tanakae TaxID=230148 RepID=A0A4Z2F8W5_9TELE|nr:hypothetical protein EYF80_052238 [Liparis tanakae]